MCPAWMLEFPPRLQTNTFRCGKAFYCNIFIHMNAFIVHVIFFFFVEVKNIFFNCRGKNFKRLPHCKYKHMHMINQSFNMVLCYQVCSYNRLPDLFAHKFYFSFTLLQMTAKTSIFNTMKKIWWLEINFSK